MTRYGGWIVFIVALALRVAYVYEHHDVLGLDVSALTQTDNHIFAAWAATIADGDVLCENQPHAYHLWTADVAPESRWTEWYGGELVYHQAPLYPYFVATIYTLIDRAHATVGYAQAVLGALTCLLTFLITRRAAGARAGLAAGLLLAFTGPYYFYDVFLLRDGPMAFLVALSTFALQRASDMGRLRDWFLAGASLGLFTLAKETGPALLVLTVVGLAIVHRRAPKALIATAAVLVVGWALVTSPAYIRNAQVGAPLTKLSTRGPEVFVTGNAIGQTGVGWHPPTTLMRSILMDSNFSLSKTMALTVATHRSDPLGYVELLWGKTSAFFNGYEVPNNVNYYLHSAHLTTLRLGAVTWTLLAPLALLGLLLGIANWRKLMVPALMLGAITGSVVLLYILARFRLQAVPLMAVFAGVSVDWIITSVQRRRVVPLVVAAIPFAIFVTWCWPSTKNPYTVDNRDGGMMMALIRAGNYDKARVFHRQLVEHRATRPVADDEEAENLERRLGILDEGFRALEAAEALPEDDPVRHIALGDALAIFMPELQREVREEFSYLAREAYDRALEVDPTIVGARHGRAHVLSKDGDIPGALAAFKEELEHHPDHGPSWRDGGMIFFTWGTFHYPEALRWLREAVHHGIDDAYVLACIARCQIDSTLDKAPPFKVGGQTVTPYDPRAGLRYAVQALEADDADPLVQENVAHVFYATAIGDLLEPTADVAVLDARMDDAVRLLADLSAQLTWRTQELDHRAAMFRQAYDKRRAARLEAEEGTDDGEDGDDP